MESTTIIVKNPNGIEASVAVKIVQKANEFPCRITISHKQRTVNAKSLFGVLALAINNRDEVILTADGEHESSALEELSRVLNG